MWHVAGKWPGLGVVEFGAPFLNLTPVFTWSQYGNMPTDHSLLRAHAQVHTTETGQQLFVSVASTVSKGYVTQALSTSEQEAES